MTAPLPLPQYRPGPHRYHTRALEELRRVTGSFGYQANAYPLPGASNATLPAAALVEVKLTLPVGSYVWGFSGSASDTAGFETQIVDMRQNAPFFTAPVLWSNITGQGSTPQGISTPMFILPQPRLVIEPAVLRVQIKNLATGNNTVQLVIFTAEPR
mgnify:CR=1 FL=1